MATVVLPWDRLEGILSPASRPLPGIIPPVKPVGPTATGRVLPWDRHEGPTNPLARPLVKRKIVRRPVARKPAPHKPARRPTVTYHPAVHAHTAPPVHAVTKPKVVAGPIAAHGSTAPDYTRAIEVGLLALGAFLVLVLVTRRKRR